MIEVIMKNGESVKLTLKMSLVLKLRNINKKAYDKYNKVYMDMQNKDPDLLYITPTIVYTAYLCGKIEDGLKKGDEVMGFDTFIDTLTDSSSLIMMLGTTLISPKTIGDLQKYLDDTQEDAVKIL